jgi:hypothetical protein
MKEGYIYLGEHYDVLGRELNISDKKIGKSITPVTREYSLNRTKSPVGYRIIDVYKVDDMDRVERMIHNILDGRRTYGEWFKDEEDTLTSEFNSFMNTYGATRTSTEELVKENQSQMEREVDTRLKDLANRFGVDTILIRKYKGVDYELLLNTDGYLVFNNQKFDTPNKFYNRGLVRYVTGVNGVSGTNQLSQFIVKDTGERLQDQ